MRTHLIAGLILALVMAGIPTRAQSQKAVHTTEPKHGVLPKSMTPEEAVIMQQIIRTRQVTGTPPPEGPIRTPAEYEPMAGILLSYEGWSSQEDILDQMAAHITTTGNADVYVMAESSFEAAQIQANMTAAGADPNRIFPIVVATDSIWIRDYGPRYIYEGDCRAIIDHEYNRRRPDDDAIPSFLAGYFNHAYYKIPLRHGGGNYHLHATGDAHCTALIANENPTLTETQIHDYWVEYQNVDTTIYTPFPTNVDSTQHIDMWLQAIADDEVIISDWPDHSGSTQDQICDNAASDLMGQGYTVHRIPATLHYGTHYTYTNVVMCNDLVLIPSYTDFPDASAFNNQALNVWQAAVPGKTVVPIDCEALVGSAGVMHCVAMHFPAHLGGETPTVYLKTPLDGQILEPGSQVQLRWISDDDLGVQEIDIDLSGDSGMSYGTSIALSLDDDGSYLWTVPDLLTSQARIRVTAWDADGYDGFDASAADFTINGSTPCPADFAPPGGDGTVDLLDWYALISQWVDGQAPYDIAPVYGDHEYGDGIVNILDALRVMEDWGPCPEE